MEPPVRGDGVHRHDDDERRNRTAPADPNGQTASLGEPAAGVVRRDVRCGSGIPSSPNVGAHLAGLMAPVGVSSERDETVAVRVEATPSRDAAFGQDDHFRLPPRTQARRLCVTRQERSQCQSSTTSRNTHRSRSLLPTATKNRCRSSANVDVAAASSEQGPVSCRERSVIGGRARRVAQTRSP
jgi:hypothetical protein